MNIIQSLPEQVFQICKEASLSFPINYVKDFDDIEPNDYGFDGEYENCRRFAALLICCSVVYVKTTLKDGVEPDPFHDKFFKPFISLILKDAENLNTYGMCEELGGGYDGEDYCIEELPEFKCMEYLSEAANEMIQVAKSGGVQLPKNLAFNYFVKPGTLCYDRGGKLEDSQKVTELNDLIGNAIAYILPKIM